MLILHGNANPVTGTEEEKDELIEISNKRAVSVAEALNAEYEKLPGSAAGVYPSERVTTSGYGGERNLAEGSTSYAGLNRRVEMILFRIETIRP
jgi:flagellar motor protein MotB